MLLDLNIIMILQMSTMKQEQKGIKGTHKGRIMMIGHVISSERGHCGSRGSWKGRITELETLVLSKDGYGRITRGMIAKKIFGCLFGLLSLPEVVPGNCYFCHRLPLILWNPVGKSRLKRPSTFLCYTGHQCIIVFLISLSFCMLPSHHLLLW